MKCTRCTAETSPGIYLCSRCAIRLGEVLEQIPDALETAQDTIAKRSKVGVGGPSSGASESTPPINLDASEKATELWESVVSNARLVLEHDSSEDLRDVEPVTYLKLSGDLIARCDFAGELVEELSHYLRLLLSAIDSPPDVVTLGQCGQLIEEEECQGRMTAQVGDEWARCKVCGSSVNVAEVQQSRAADAWGSFDTLANVVSALRLSGFKINPKSAQRWAAKGDMPAHQYRSDGVALYSPGQVVDAHQRMKMRRGRPKRDSAEKVR